MQKEFDVVLARSMISLGMSGVDLPNFLRETVDPIAQVYTESIKEYFAKTKSGLGMVVKKFREKGEGNPAYCLAYFLDVTRDVFFEKRALDVINNPNQSLRWVAAVMLDVNSGFKYITKPLILVHQAYPEVSKEAQDSLYFLRRMRDPTISRMIPNVIAATMEDWADWKQLLDKDPTGYSLIESQLKSLLSRKENLYGYGVREIVIAGAELASKVYQTHYQDAVQMVDRNL